MISKQAIGQAVTLGFKRISLFFVFHNFMEINANT